MMIAATFTVEPVEQVLAYWCRSLELDADLHFAPYDQVFPQLLDPASEMSCNPRGLNVILLRIEDLARGNNAALRSRTAEFIGAVEAAASRCPAPLLVVTCPPGDTPGALAEHSEADGQLAAQWPTPGKVTLLRAEDILKTYPVDEPLDPSGVDSAQIPYSDELFAARRTIVDAELIVDPVDL